MQCAARRCTHYLTNLRGCGMFLVTIYQFFNGHVQRSSKADELRNVDLCCSTFDQTQAIVSDARLSSHLFLRKTERLTLFSDNLMLDSCFHSFPFLEFLV